MALSPDMLLAKAARAQCIANIKKIQLPPFLTPNSSHFSNLDIPEQKQAAVLVPLCVVNDEVCLLYTLRSPHLSIYSGEVSFPGGTRDHMESVFDTALRETEEEIGFPREQVDVWTEMHPIMRSDGRIVVTPIIGLLRNYDPKTVKINSDEVVEVFCVPIARLCDTDHHAYFMYNNVHIPVYLDEKHIIWGLTSLITHLFLSAFLPSDLYTFNFTSKSFLYENLTSSKL